MKNILTNIFLTIVILFFGYLIVAAATNTFPTSLNSWSDDDTIESEWANALEDKIGIDNSAITTSLDYILKNVNSLNPGHTHSTSSVSGIFGVSQGGIGIDISAIAKGGLLTGTGAGTMGILTVGANGTVATASSTATGGISWETGGSGITSLNGLTGATQTFATSTSGNLFLRIGSTGTTHTFTTGIESGYSIPLTASTTNFQTSYEWGDHSVAGYITSTSTPEQIQDVSGAMFSGNTETLITATYQDSDGTVDLIVDNDLANYSNSNAGFCIASNNLSDLTSTSTARTNLGVTIGSDVQAYDIQLVDIAGLAVTDSGFIVGNGTNFVLETGGTLQTSMGIGTGDSPTFTGLTLTSPISGFLKTNGSGVIATSSIDISADTNLVGGTGITLTDDTLSCDLGTSIDISSETNLSVPATGIELSGDTIVLTTDYEISTTASTTNWTTAYGWGDHSTGGYCVASNNLSDLTSTSTARTNLGLVIGTNVQAWDDDLDDLAGLTPTKGDLMTTAGTNWVDFAVGVNGKVLTASSTATNGISWETFTGGGDLLAANNLSDVASTSTAKSNLGMANVENTALSTWIGSGNITTLGTIISGLWNGSTIGDSYLTESYIKANGTRAFTGNQSFGGFAITNATNTNWDTAYTHSQDNTQAHSDYMLNTGDTSTGDYDFTAGNLTTTGLGTFGEVISNGDISASTDGSSTSTPRVFGYKDLTSGEAARFQFGDSHNAFQNAYSQDVTIYSYWGLVLSGGMQNYNSGFAPPSFTKTTDTGVLILSTNDIGDDPGAGATNIVTLGIQAVAGQTNNLTEWRDSSGTVLSSVDSSGNVGIGTSTPSYALDVIGDLRVNTSSTLGNIISGIWNATAIDFSSFTNATAGTGITFTDDTISADLGTSIDISSETNLSVPATGIELSGDTIALTTDYEISTTASTTNWTTAYGWGDHSTGGYCVASNNLSDLTSTSTARTNLGLVIGTNVQAWDDDLDDLAGLTPTKGDLMTTAGTNWVDFAVGVNGKVLTASSTAANGISWETFTGGGDLLAANNLSDVASTSTAKSNLGMANVENTALSTWIGSGNITTLGTIVSGIWNGTAIDISSNTNLAAGRSLTMSGDSVEADAELYEDEFSIVITSATTTYSGKIQKLFFNPITIKEVNCSSDGANITIGLDERASSTPQSSGTDIFNGGTLVCDSNSNSTSTFANAGIASGYSINLDIDTITDATSTLRVNVYYGKND